MIDVVGIGAGGWDSLEPRARELVVTADRVYGSPRQLALLPEVSRQVRTDWPTPLRPALTGLLADHDRARLVVVASGDPLLAGVATTLVEVFGAAAVRVHPGVSSVSLAGARLGWAAETVDVVRLNTAEATAIGRYLSPGRRLVVLSRDRTSPAAVAAVLRESGFGASEVVVLADLGTDYESRVDGTAATWTEGQLPDLDVLPDLHLVPDLNVVCVTCRPDRASGLWSSAPGLPDEAYEHDGQLTKRDIRASALAHLAPAAGELLWDVGAGAGSVGIEWLRIHPRCRAVAVEQDGARAERIRSNAVHLGVPELKVVVGAAPDALAGLPIPDAVFVGGGATGETVEVAWRALAGGGRLVVHAVTQQTERVVSDCWQRLGGQLTRISVELMQPIGGFSGWQPARAVVQWSIQKPLADQEAS